MSTQNSCSHICSNIEKRQRMETTQVFIKGLWISKLWHIPAMGYDSSRKRNGLPMHARIWINLKKHCFKQKNLVTKDPTHTIPFTGIVQNRPIRRDKVGQWLPRTRGKAVVRGQAPIGRMGGHLVKLRTVMSAHCKCATR